MRKAGDLVVVAAAGHLGAEYRHATRRPTKAQMGKRYIIQGKTLRRKTIAIKEPARVALE